MPKPAAEFSALAITRSIRWKSTIPASSRRTSSRPGLPTISPMNRIRTLSAYMEAGSLWTRRGGGSERPALHDGDRNGVAAALGDLGDRDPQLAVGKPGACVRRVARAAETDHARKTAVSALHEMKARLGPRPARGLLAGNQQAVAFGDHADGGRIDAGEVHGDLESVIRFVDVERRRALAGQRLRAEDAAELQKDLADVCGKIADLGGEGDGVDGGNAWLDHRIAMG